MLNWKNAIHRASTKLLVEINRDVYHIAWDLFTTVVRFTPSPSNPGKYASGLLANQWYPSEGTPSAAHTTSRNSHGAESLARIDAMRRGGTAFYEKDGRVTLTNNSEHAYRAEALGWPKPRWRGKEGDGGYGGGNKPYRMVARSLMLIAAKYD